MFFNKKTKSEDEQVKPTSESEQAAKLAELAKLQAIAKETMVCGLLAQVCVAYGIPEDLIRRAALWLAVGDAAAKLGRSTGSTLNHLAAMRIVDELDAQLTKLALSVVPDELIAMSEVRSIAEASLNAQRADAMLAQFTPEPGKAAN